ncbi:hypothetical protein ABK040_002427 [Willaertia magna]
MKKCYYTFFSDEFPSPLQPNAATINTSSSGLTTSSFTSNGSNTGSGQIKFNNTSGNIGGLKTFSNANNPLSSSSTNPNNSNTASSYSTPPHFISKQEKERLRLNFKKTVSIAFIGMGNDKALDITNQILKRPIFKREMKSTGIKKEQQQASLDTSATTSTSSPTLHSSTNSGNASNNSTEGFVLVGNVMNADKLNRSSSSSTIPNNNSTNQSSNNTENIKKKHPVTIDSYHDVEQGRIYLYADIMQKPEHCKTFIEQFLSQKIEQTINNPNLFPTNNYCFDLEQALDYERILHTLLFLFQTCHMIFFITPTSQVAGTVCSNLHQSLLTLFRVLQISKNYVNSKILDLIHSGTLPVNDNNPTMNMINTILGSGVMSSLYSPGRVLPVISFIFVHERIQFNRMVETCQKQNQNKSIEDINEYLLNRLQSSLENQVRNQILRKGKFSGIDNTKTPLFMLDPQTCTFVIVEPQDVNEAASFNKRKELNQTRNVLFSLSKMNLNNNDQQQDSNSIYYPKATSSPFKKPSNEIKKLSDEASYLFISKVSSFIQKQHEYFLKQMQVGKRFILPYSLHWYQATFAFEELFSLDNQELQKALLEKSKEAIHPNLSFSEKRCKQAFNIVKEQFLQKVNNPQMKVVDLANETITRYNSFACGFFNSYYQQELQSFLKPYTSKTDANQNQGKHNLPYPFTQGSPILFITIDKAGEYNTILSTSSSSLSSTTSSESGGNNSVNNNGTIKIANQLVNLIEVHLLPKEKFSSPKKKKKKFTKLEEVNSSSNVIDSLWIGFEYETPRKNCFLTFEQLALLYKQQYHSTELNPLEMILKTNIPLFLPSNWFIVDKRASVARLKQIIIGVPDINNLPFLVTFSPKISAPSIQQVDSTVGTNTSVPNTQSTGNRVFGLSQIKNGISISKNQFVVVELEYDSSQLSNYNDLTSLQLLGGSIQLV